MRRAKLESEERRRGIVDAAMPLFARRGFAGTTTKEIARAAGVSEALVFQHFPSKVALYQEMLKQGCEGDPALEKLLALPPSTETLVSMLRMMLHHFVFAALGDPAENDVKHRLMLNSFLEDGEYARLVFGWVDARIFPLFEASVIAAQRAGDLVSPSPRLANFFWFGEHVAATIAYARLNGSSAIPYEGTIEEVVADASRFLLRGLGVTEAAIERHLATPMFFEPFVDQPTSAV